jgi:Domain of unknown function (DUF4333)
MGPVLATLPLVGALALASCGHSTIDAARAEKFIRRVVSEQVGARVATVTCPEDVETRKGAQFTCVVTGTDRSRGDVVVTQRDDDGSVVVDAPFLHVRAAEAVMAQQVGEEVSAEEVKVACPEIVVVIKGGLFKCKARSTGDSRDLSVRLTDDEGRFRYRLTEPPRPQRSS